MNKKYIVFSGFMLFSLFFGAGNLIFPPILGLESGSNFVPAIIGFLITGVLLPFMAVISISLSDNGLVSIGNRVHSIFGILFAIVIYLSIGAFYGIPRASNVAYELGFIQIFQVDNDFMLLLFTLIFFLVTYAISLNPKKIIDRVGQILTPILLAVLAILFIQAFFQFSNPISQPIEKYNSSPFINGFLEGYYTMDAIAALAFGIVIVNGLKDKGTKSKTSLIKGTIGAGVLASISLIIVYVSLGWMGVVIPKEIPFTNGAQILVSASSMLFGGGGSMLFGTIVMLACLTTSIGLTNACSRFFHQIYPNYSYQTYVGVFVLIGLLVSNLGLDLILEVATPLLVFIYPISIVLIVLSLFQPWIGESKTMYRMSILFTTFFAIYELLLSIDIQSELLSTWLGVMPFFDKGLGWIVPALIGALAGYILDLFALRNQNVNNTID
ncbi:branched-chain amino acid transport system II carrier protein [Oceanobacillus halophilus]|uniref:Branched-chain amino acid transport system carrier protein n=1 Tax=Oceanobacillus halophilus TaxID=930130 RepID=A0A495A0X1_9BACI|nr:branched-chain amino acid transport system II carrier protein [Oceanobacillus halophilus]RKQ32928.1 branched-chain amino acid transport system II carrier protein [Oceanobacillus halophilus]